MATDFAPYANFRFLWNTTGPIANFRQGVPRNGTTYLIQAFMRGTAGNPEKLADVIAGESELAGYITAWATLQAGGSYQIASTGLSWNTTGLAPAGLLPGAHGKAFLGKLESLPTIVAGGQHGEARVLALNEPYGVGGIGDELRRTLGDKIRVQFNVVR